jgi:hypothetical protein
MQIFKNKWGGKRAFTAEVPYPAPETYEIGEGSELTTFKLGRTADNQFGYIQDQGENHDVGKPVSTTPEEQQA